MSLEGRRTKRRYAHELYPHAQDGQVRPLPVEVPYLYARMVGFDVWGTSWFDIRDEPNGREVISLRLQALIATREQALLADALLQGMTGQDAWDWAQRYAADETGECAYDRAAHYGVPIAQIKPYPCGPMPGHHGHETPSTVPGWRDSVRVEGAEDDCMECTEPVEEKQ